jgi:ATP-binding cassette subfamily B multidrug efflux pump
MFQLRFHPTFARQRAALLSQTKVPDLALVSPLENALNEMTDASATKRITSFQLWMKCLRANRPLLAKAFLIASFASAAATGSTLVAMKILKNQSDLRTLLLFAVVYYVMNALAQFGSYSNNRLRFWIGLTIETTLVAAISKKLVRLSAASAARQSSGNLKVLITSDVKTIGEFLNNFVRNMIPSAVALAIMTPLLVHFSGKAGVIGILTLAMIIPVAFGLNVISTRLQYKTQARMDELTSLVGEWVKNIRLVRFLSWEEALQQKITNQLRQFMSVAVLQHLMACLIFGLSTTWWMITATSILVFANYFHYPLDVSGFFGSLWLLTFIAGYFTHIPNTIRLFGLATPSMKRIATLLSEPEQSEAFIQDQATLPAESALPTRMIFEDVSFAAAIRHLSLEIDLSEKLAVLGEVGSGKSTLLKLICGEVPPTEGSIFVEFSDGKRYPFWKEAIYHRFRGRLAFVPQQPYVSSDLLSANISLSEEENDTEIMRSAQMAELAADLEQLPLGLRQPIGESGVNLSGGQKQRLNLARAFFANRPYLVLDDTLSAVDSKTEALLMKQLSLQQAGFILVTHRLNEIMSVGQVIVLKNGQLVESGTPQALAAQADSAFNRALQAYDHAEPSLSEVPHE